MKCLHCGKKLGVLRKLQKNDEFCSAAHCKAYAKKQNDDALDFLLKSKPVLRPPVQHAVDAETPAPSPVAPKPLLVRAQFVPEPVAPGIVSALPMRNAQPVEHAQAAVLPAGAHAAEPRLLRSHRNSSAILAHAAPVDGLRLPAKCATPFEAGRPRVRVTIVHPIWIGVERPVEAKRRHAGFVTMRPTWINLTSHPLRAGATARFALQPAIARTNLAPHRPAFRLATATRSSAHPSHSPAHAIEHNGSAWQLYTVDVRMQTVATVVRASGPRPCGRILVAPPQANPAPECAAAAIAAGPVTTPERLLLQLLLIIPRTLSLTLAPRAHLD